MKHLIVSLFAVILTLGLGVADAEAKRLGGGGSFGMQRQMTPQQAPRAPAAAPQQAPQGTTAGAQPRRSWMGPIAGLAAGLGLAALFSHLGMGEELGSFVMIALLVGGAFMLFRMLSRRSAPAQASGPLQYAGAAPISGAAPPAGDWRASAAGAQAGTPSTLPPDFDAEAFVRQAKLHFIRLQAANDSGNLEDIHAFTTPEVFAEIRLQLSERGTAQQRTDVMELNADVIEVAEDGDRYIVSVRFNGLLREEAEAAPTPFDEVWHLAKPAHGSGEGWRVAGIQQVA